MIRLVFHTTLPFGSCILYPPNIWDDNVDEDKLLKEAMVIIGKETPNWTQTRLKIEYYTNDNFCYKSQQINITKKQ